MDERRLHQQPHQLRRRPDGSSLLGAALALPGFLGGLTVMSLLGYALLPALPWLIPVLWILSGAALFARPVETTLAPLLYGARRPIDAEWHAMAAPWWAVCARAGIDGSRYLLLVQDSTDVNAFAAGGRTVAVTRASLHLHPSQLEAVLAHELGHHLSGHTMVSTLAWWYALPARAAALLVGYAVRFVLAVGRIFQAFGNGLGALVSVLAALLLLTVLMFLSFWLLLIPLTAPLLALASRLGEFQADRTAALLGYGPALVQVLTMWLTSGDTGQRIGVRARMLASHPSHADRIRRLQPYA